MDKYLDPKKQLQEWLALSLDQPLNPEAAKQLEEALLHSETLREDKAVLLRMRSELLGWKPEPVPGFLQEVKKGIEKRQREAMVLYLFPRIAVASIVIAVGIALLSAYFSDRLSDKMTLGVELLEPDDAYGFIASE